MLADVGCLALNADTDAAGLKAAKSAALWLYSNGAGEDALTETLGVVTPWNTAADSTAVLAMQIEQVGTGILPGAVLDTATAEALTANELSLQGSEKHTKAERTALTAAALQALGAGEKRLPPPPPRGKPSQRKPHTTPKGDTYREEEKHYGI